MVRIPSSTLRQEVPPGRVSHPETGEHQAGEVVELDAEEGERVSVVVPAGVMVEVSKAVAGEEPKMGPVEPLDAGAIPPAPDPAIASATTGDSPSPQAPSDSTPTDDRTAFKVVLALKPADQGRWHATIAVGRDGCDPVFEPADVADWPEALDAVLGVRTAAVARWAEQPRNATAPIRIGGVKATQTVGGPAPVSKRKASGDDNKPTASGETTTDSGSAAEGAVGRGDGKTDQTMGAADRPAARRRHGKSAAPASVGKVAATVVDGGVEKLSLF